MKKIFYIPLLVITFTMFGCGEDFLEQKNLYEVYDVDYYKTPEDIQSALTAAYSCLSTDGGVNNPTLIANLMSDDCFGGGGINDVGFQDIDGFRSSSEDLYLELWETLYKGVFRTNMIIKRFDQAEYEDESAKNQALGEAYFLRAYFNLKLAQFFGTFTLKTEPDPSNLPKATPEAIFAQIGADLKMAITIMPGKKSTSLPAESLGHATKWSAEALMARAYLFYTGYYNKADIALADGSTITKSQVVTWIDDCIANSGHGLIPDFRNQWPYAYANVDYDYAADNNLEWVGEDGDNFETMFAVKYSPYGGWAPPAQQMSYSNQLTLYMAMRGQEGLMPFGTGWGAGPANPQLFDSYEANDVRKSGTITDVTDPAEGDVSENYVWGVWEAMHETGLWQKKYTPIQVNTDAGLKGMYFVLLGSPDNYQLWNMQDEVLIRFADVLLMGAELGSGNAQSYLDQVRSRAGLTSVPVSLEAIKTERRHELAFEGIRYFDLLRWHDAEAAFAKVKDVPVKNLLLDETYTATFRPETGGFLPIPESQVILSNGVLTQNPGWE